MNFSEVTESLDPDPHKKFSGQEHWHYSHMELKRKKFPVTDLGLHLTWKEEYNKPSESIRVSKQSYSHRSLKIKINKHKEEKSIVHS
jgi:hypothetical protein